MGHQAQAAAPPQQTPNLFLDTLRELRGGVSLEELSAHLQALVASVQHTGKKGSLSYVITVRPASAGSTGQLILADAITVKEPKLERSSDIFFATQAGELTRRNPNQRELNLREIDKPANGEVREVSRG